MLGEELYKLLGVKAGFEVVKETTPSDGQIRIIGRVHQEKMGSWLPIIKNLLVKSGTDGWSVDISKQYLVHASEDLRFCWRLIFQAQGGTLEEMVKNVVFVVQSSPLAKVEVMSQPLVGRHIGRGSVRQTSMDGSSRP